MGQVAWLCAVPGMRSVVATLVACLTCAHRLTFADSPHGVTSALPRVTMAAEAGAKKKGDKKESVNNAMEAYNHVRGVWGRAYVSVGAIKARASYTCRCAPWPKCHRSIGGPTTLES